MGNLLCLMSLLYTERECEGFTAGPAAEGPWADIDQKALPSAGDQEDVASAG